MWVRPTMPVWVRPPLSVWLTPFHKHRNYTDKIILTIKEEACVTICSAGFHVFSTPSHWKGLSTARNILRFLHHDTILQQKGSWTDIQKSDRTVLAFVQTAAFSIKSKRIHPAIANTHLIQDTNSIYRWYIHLQLWYKSQKMRNIYKGERKWNIRERESYK